MTHANRTTYATADVTEKLVHGCTISTGHRLTWDELVEELVAAMCGGKSEIRNREELTKTLAIAFAEDHPDADLALIARRIYFEATGNLDRAYDRYCPR